jgi:hypothetical protein
MTAWEKTTTSMDRMVPLKDVLDACMAAYELGDWDRYMPWRFMGEHVTREECDQLDSVMDTYSEGDENG